LAQLTGDSLKESPAFFASRLFCFEQSFYEPQDKARQHSLDDE
jgi:hypothetical protein